MLKESTKSLCRVSPEKNFRRELRKGQRVLLERCKETKSKLLNVKWPGGYGKSLGIAIAFRAMLERKICDRLLIIVANDTQREQVLNDFKQDCGDVALEIPSVWKVTGEASTYRANRTGQHCVFVTTIQQVESSYRGSFDVTASLLDDGDHKWMIAADEYHHYAESCPWGTALKALTEKASFVLATSATPFRDKKSTIFGEPHLEVSYEDAKNEGAVKPILRRCYEYRIDYLDKNCEPLQFSSTELREQVGDAANIDGYEAKKELRHSSKYILPIVSEPILRLQERRISSGLKLQMLVRAMGCKHAKIVCGQIKALCEDLSVDWIGTGEYGRTDEENREIKSLFCPKKNAEGKRPEPQLDILVQVGMADEGFDSIMVAEIVDLHIVTLEGASNKTKQFYKRGTRAVGEECLFINVGTDHPLAALDGNQVEAWLDSDLSIAEVVKEVPKEEDHCGPKDFELPDSLPETKEAFKDAELTDTMIDEHPLKPKFDRDMKARYGEPTEQDLRDWFRKALSGESQDRTDEITLTKQRELIDKVVGQIALKAVRMKGGEFERSMIGDYRHRINGKLISLFHRKRSEMLKDELASVYEYLKAMHESISEGEVPSWLR